MSIEETIRELINQELDKRTQSADIVPVEQFCQDKGVSRITIWRAEKEGRLKVVRIGKRKFIDTRQWSHPVEQ